ncbi:hypothetical protein [Nitrospira sp. Kam-Ns4a]
MDHKAHGLSDSDVEDLILGLLYSRRRLSFLELADAMAGYQWRRLFEALFRLQQRQQVDLRPLAGDYEIRLVEANALGADDSSHRGLGER